MLSILTNKRLKGHLHVSLILCSLLFLFYWFHPQFDNFLMSTPFFHCSLTSFCSSPQSLLLNCQYESSPFFFMKAFCSMNIYLSTTFIFFVFHKIVHVAQLLSFSLNSTESLISSFISVLTISEVCSLLEFVSFVFSLFFWYPVVIHGGLIRCKGLFQSYICWVSFVTNYIINFGESSVGCW